jgi:subtilisin family serine protease
MTDMRIFKYVLAISAMLILLTMPVYAEDYIVTLKEGITVEGLEPIVEAAGLYITDKETAEELYAKGLAEDICPDEALTLEPITDDNYVSSDSNKLRSMSNNGYNDPNYSEEVYFEQLKIKDYIDTYNPSGNVRIAVIDTGVNREHQELRGANIETGYNYVLNSTDTNDYYGHGTLVTGVLASAVNNGLGGSGICPNATIVPLVAVTKVNGEEQSSLSALLQAIYAAVDTYDCRIITASMGMTKDTYVLDNAVRYAINNGVIFISAAGNDGASSNSSALSYPASCDGVISVGATDSSYNRASYSQKNTRVDTVAFGGYFKLPSNSSETSYSRVNGTSYSTPVITGLTALFVSQHPDITNTEYRRILFGSAMDIGELGNGDYMGYGMPDCMAMEELYSSNESTYISPIYENGTRNIKVVSTNGNSTAMLVCVDFNSNAMKSYRIKPLYFSDGIAWVSDEGDTDNTKYFVVEDLENLKSLSVSRIMS